MPDFRIRDDVRAWFSHIAGPTSATSQTLFDAYYWCFLLGVSVGTSVEPSDSSGISVFTDNFVRPYDVEQKKMVGLVIDAELRRLHVQLEDRSEVNEVVKGVATSAGPTVPGLKLLDRYSSGGFEELLERYPGIEPRTMEEFMPRYLRILDECLVLGPRP